jgi:hypothetical protein
LLTLKYLCLILIKESRLILNIMALELIEISDISAKIGLSSPVDGVLVYSSSSTTAERIPKRPFRSFAMREN